MPHRPRRTFAGLLLGLACASGPATAATWRVLAWSDLGMQSVDASYAVFSLAPPFGALEAQVLRDGLLVTDPSGITVRYRAIADPDASINRTSQGKSDLSSWALDLFGVALAPDAGLMGNDMPGAANVPQPLPFDAARAVWSAAGIPITPEDDAGRWNPYPLLRVEVRDAATSALLAQTDVVLPVSDEVRCADCHASDTRLAAKPAIGWVHDPDPLRDPRLNVLALHDQNHRYDASYPTLLAQFGYAADGLLATVQQAGKPILCADCHATGTLAASGADGVSTLTRAMHKRHARVRDPIDNVPLDDRGDRAACYACHPGFETRQLRGVMGRAVASDGSPAIECQSCHGGMSEVRTAGRSGWLDEPSCQSCHTGTAVNNDGQIRYTDVHDSVTGLRRVAVDTTFATTPDVPSAPWSLYRLSTGHGGLACAACHGSTHAEAPTAERNDGLATIALQGYTGPLVECTACHTAGLPATTNGGPHGMHPVGQWWVDHHGDQLEQVGVTSCQTCHGPDYRGMELSRTLADRSLTTEKFGPRFFWRGYQVSCFACHDGPQSADNAATDHPAAVANASAETSADVAVAIPLSASDVDGDSLTLRIVSQPEHGTVGLAGSVATYYPDRSAVGSQHFTVAAWDGKLDSNLATVDVLVPEPAANACAVAIFATLAALARRKRPYGS